MNTVNKNGDIKRHNQTKIIKYILEHKQAARQELATAIGLSMPTVIQNIATLIELGLVYEAGEYSSTGGRKARILKVCSDFCSSIGVEVKKNTVRMVLVDFGMNIVSQKVYPLAFEDTPHYYAEFIKCVNQFITSNQLGLDPPHKLAGIGISIPGIINQDLHIVQQSHILQVKNLELHRFTGNLPYEVYFENDANNAAFAEMRYQRHNVVYLSLNDTVGGAIYFNGQNYTGQNFKSAELGHMVIVPDGRTCYCGKKGCLDAYCSAEQLLGRRFVSLDEFFAALDRGDQECVSRWDEYMDYLALACGNLRIIFDCDIMLGGDVGGYMQKYLHMFAEKLQQYCNFDYTMSFLRIGNYRHESSAIGAAYQMIYRFLDNQFFSL